jgi:hypothetical protein
MNDIDFTSLNPPHMIDDKDVENLVFMLSIIKWYD